jgi:hypothetical protein
MPLDWATAGAVWGTLCGMDRDGSCCGRRKGSAWLRSCDALQEARNAGSLLEASEVAEVVTFMLTRPRGMALRDVITMPTNFYL